MNLKRIFLTPSPWYMLLVQPFLYSVLQRTQFFPLHVSPYISNFLSWSVGDSGLPANCSLYRVLQDYQSWLCMVKNSLSLHMAVSKFLGTPPPIKFRGHSGKLGDTMILPFFWLTGYVIVLPDRQVYNSWSSNTVYKCYTNSNHFIILETGIPNLLNFTVFHV